MHLKLKPHRHVASRLHKRDDPPTLDSDILEDSLDKRANDVATVFSVVYVTASATFSGPTAGFVTLGADSTTTAKASKPTAASNGDNDDDNTTTAKAKQTTTASAKSSSATSTSSSKVTSTLSPTAKSTATTLSSSSSSSTLVSSSLAVLTSSAAVSSTIATSSINSSAAKAQATSSSSASSSAVADASSSGMSTGAKAGIALMVICVIGVCAGLAYFFIRKKKAQQKQAIGMERLDDEKKGFMAQSPSTMTIPQPPPQTHSSGPAPRVSYRPGSQFSASVLGDAEKAAAGAAAGVMAGRNSDPSNPFGIHAQTVDAQSRDVISPIPEERSLSPPVELQGSPVPSPTAASFNVNSPVTPGAEVKAEVGMASVVPVAALSGAAPGAVIADPPGSTVHRVQLEFKPSMDDELELKVGQIVRVLHEYDDGWALCIRMDRSQQGVAPRTCLSKLPLKPRPMGPPPGAKNGPPRAVPRPGQGLMGPPPRPIPGAKVRQNSSSSQGSAVSQPRRPSIQPSKQSSPTLAEQAQSRQRSMSVAASPTKAPRQTEQQRAVSAAEAHSRSASMGTASSAEKSSTASGATTPLGVPARKPVPGQAL
ncbi:hypothetical protein D6C97_04952 [Aureobasidium pullulans]|nr:hypothetical protein D6C97_04952 [Aureobasidium pullulans]TIA85167.1 hypothetical protein D6C76_01172 [Aureobasidium pullulans]